MRTFKVLGLLLTYPSAGLLSARQELVQVLESEGLLSDRHIRKVAAFLKERASRDILDVQEEYVDTFDRGRAHCLHLFEHIHGESRDRGQAMVNLSETYSEKGLYIDSNELPDYLPLFLEFLARCDLREACEYLGLAVDVVALIGAKLRKRRSPYADIFGAIEALSEVSVDSAKLRTALEKAPKDPETLDQLDEQWKEADAFSGDPLADCNSCEAIEQAQRSVEKMTGGLS